MMEFAREMRETGSLAALYARLSQANMGPGWNKPEPSLWPAPRKTFVPAHWSYAVARAALDAAGPLISTDQAERRNLILANPVPGNSYATSRTLVAAYQMVMAGERARVHRHTPSALRLVIDAEPDTFTVVERQRIRMSPGDVLLTPNWMWHGHINDSVSSAYWVDFLDAPLVQLIEPMFLEHSQESMDGPIDEASPMRFRHAETLARLDRCEGQMVELESTQLKTIAVFVHRLDQGRAVPAMRSTASSIYAVIDGQGQSIIDGEVFSWTRGDVFVAPAWREHWHEATERSHLLRVTDEPVLRQLGLFRSSSASDT